MKIETVEESVKDETSQIRRIIKSRCPTVPVRMATGTSYGWVYIRAGFKNNHGRSFTKDEIKILRSFGLNPGGNIELIRPTERKNFIAMYKK